MRVCAIGLDSASITLIERLCDRGDLPHFRALRDRSVRHRLRSGDGHRHGTLWAQFVAATELAVDRPGFRCSFDPRTYAPYEEPAQHELAGRPPFWETAGVSTITFDVPRTTIDGPGVHVTGWGTHAPSYPRASQPRGLLREIDRRFGPHPATGNEHDCGWHDPDRLDRLTRALETGAERRAEITDYLMQRFPDWELFVTVMSESHAASEIMWHGVDDEHVLAGFDPAAGDRLTRVHRAMDRALGTIVGALTPDDTVLLFSLDGMKSSHGDLPSTVLLPELLHRARFGTALVHDPDQEAWRTAGFPVQVPRRGDLWRHHLDDHLIDTRASTWRRRLQRHAAYDRVRSSRPGRRVVATVKRAPLGVLGIPIPPESDASPETMAQWRQPLDEILFVGNYAPYRARMRTFVLPSFGEGFLRMNLAGRERDGCVALAEYDAERRAVDALIRGCRDPRDGSPVAGGIEWFGADTALDPDRRPYADGIVAWTHPTDAFEHPTVGTIGPFPLHRTGVHDGVGFIWSAGPATAPGDGATRSVLDLPAMILSTFDMPASSAGVAAD
jgi:predicted AlkP superfamily phosphohydrolase/phosphomutase